MASKGPKKPPAARRRPPTIDLTATEVRVEPAAPAPGEAAPADESSAAITPDAGIDPTGGAPDATPTAPSAPATEFEAEPAAAQAATPAPEPPPRRSASDDDALPPRAPPPAPPKTPWGLTAVMAGGAILLVVALALSVINFVEPRDTTAAQLAARVATLESQLARRSDQPAVDPKAVDALAARLAKVETAAAAPQPPATDPTLASRLSSIEIALKSLADTAASLNGRSQELSAALREARERSEVTAKALNEMQAAIERQRASAANAPDKGDVEALAARIGVLESSTRIVEHKLETPGSTAADRGVRIAVLAAALKDAVVRGSPYGGELAAIKPLVDDANAVAALEPFAASGAPTDAALAHELAALVPALTQAATPPAQQGGFLDRLQSNASRLVRIRPVDEPVGDDPATVVARIDGKAQRADIPGALSELARLPAAVRALAQAWIAKAEAREEAFNAAQKIASGAFGALTGAAH